MRVTRFGEDEERKKLVFHLMGLIEAANAIAGLTRELDQLFGKNAEKAAEKATYIQVEVYDHLAYHIGLLRRPLARFCNSLYRELGGTAHRPGKKATMKARSTRQARNGRKRRL